MTDIKIGQHAASTNAAVMTLTDGRHAKLLEDCPQFGLAVVGFADGAIAVISHSKIASASGAKVNWPAGIEAQWAAKLQVALADARKTIAGWQAETAAKIAAAEQARKEQSAVDAAEKSRFVERLTYDATVRSEVRKRILH